MALDATNACFNELTIGHKLTAIWTTLVEILQIYDPMANPSPIEAAQNACFNVLTSGQQFTAMWVVLDAILTASGGGGGGVNYFGNGSPEGVITAGVQVRSTSSLTVQGSSGRRLQESETRVGL